MKTVWKVWGTVLVLAIVGSLVWLMAAYLWGPPLDQLPMIHIDDESVTIGGGSALHGALAVTGVIVALLVVATVVPLVVAISLAVAGLGVAVGLTAAAFGVLLPLSPFILIGWLIWRALRGPKSGAAAPATPQTPPSPPAAAATIAG